MPNYSYLVGDGLAPNYSGLVAIGLVVNYSCLVADSLVPNPALLPMALCQIIPALLLLAFCQIIPALLLLAFCQIIPASGGSRKILLPGNGHRNVERARVPIFWLPHSGRFYPKMRINPKFWKSTIQEFFKQFWP